MERPALVHARDRRVLPFGRTHAFDTLFVRVWSGFFACSTSVVFADVAVLFLSRSSETSWKRMWVRISWS